MTMKIVDIIKTLKKDYKITVAEDANSEYSDLFNYFNIIAYRNTPNGPDIRFINVNEKYNEHTTIVYNNLYVLKENFNIDFPTVEYFVTMNYRNRHYVLIHGKWRKMLDRYVYRDIKNAFIEKRIIWGEKGILIFSEDNALFIPNNELYDTFDQKFNYEYPKKIIYKSIGNDENAIEKIRIFNTGVKLGGLHKR